VSIILFNSFAFLYFGIVILLALLIIKTKRYQYILLLISSYYFYYFSSSYFVVLLLFSSLLDFFCGKAIYMTEGITKRKFYLLLSIIGNLGILTVFKYTDFAIGTVNTIGTWFGYNPNIPLVNLILPIGISFFTFQTMSYTFDIYRKKLEPVDSFLKFSLFVSFFPQLVAGPIVRAAHLLPQLKNKIIITQENFKHGLTQIMWGLVKKVVIADNIAHFVNIFFANPTLYPGSIPIILGAVAFTIQIYCDFSGYSDIAIGAGRIMGFRFLDNFDKPFFSKSIAEFWKRWHISLSTWFRDYLFTPLMGKRFTMMKLYVSVFIVYVVSGLWHGAGWNFVAWGVLHGSFLIISMVTDKWRGKFNEIIKLTMIPRFHKLIKIFVTLYLVVFSLLLFRLYDASYILYAAKKFIFLDLSNFVYQVKSLLPAFEISFLFMGIFIIVHAYTYFKRRTLENIAKKGLFEWTIYLTCMILILYFFSPTESIQFIYFQF
jgi:alginate O-acetyltransferase complex protein AlgI